MIGFEVGLVGQVCQTVNDVGQLAIQLCARMINLWRGQLVRKTVQHRSVTGLDTLAWNQNVGLVDN